jgi:DNA-binding FadR family transcriptional regulator
MDRIKMLNSDKKSHELFKQMKNAILSGEFNIGEKLPSESELMELFQADKSAIKEVIRVLELAGFVEVRLNPVAGVYVTDLLVDHVSDAFLNLFLAQKVTIPELIHVRQFIEPEVARLAALNISDSEDYKRLTDANDAEFQPTKNMIERIYRLQRVNVVLAEICGNRFLEAILKSTMKLTWQIVIDVFSEPEILHMPGEHIAVVEAVLDNDAASAQTMMKVHTYEFCNRLIRMEKLYLKKTMYRKIKYMA